MNNKTIILLTILATVAVLIGGYSIYQYELGRNEMYYNTGYNNGLLYTQQTGNIAFSNNGTLEEITIVQVCNNIIQQELNQQQGGQNVWKTKTKSFR